MAGGGPLARRSAADLLKEGARELLEHLERPARGEGAVVRLQSPGEVRGAFAARGAPLALGAGDPALGDAALLAAVRTVLELSVQTDHPLFLNQLYSRADPFGVLGDWLVTATNTNVHTYEVAPVYTLVEQEVLNKVGRVLGGGFGGEADAEGLCVPGGSISNMYAMHLARFRAVPEARTKGLHGLSGGPLVAFTSEQCHYSYKKSVSLLGVGTDNLVAVGCDESGAMKPDLLAKAVEETLSSGGRPFFVGATAGTTVQGAFDPFDAIADVCQKFGLWMHVDGAWGGSAILSEKHQALCHGLERADSFAWNPHKMMGAPLQCSFFITQHRGMLKEANGMAASYLFQPDKLYTECDLGDKTIQCGRKPDALKMWMMWKAHGDAGLAARVDHSMALAEHWEKRVRESGGKFVMSQPRTFTNTCFWVVPEKFRPFDPATADEKTRVAIGKVAPAIKANMQKAGDAMIGYQPLNGLPNFFRIVFANCDDLTFDDLDALLGRMERIGEVVAQDISAE